MQSTEWPLQHSEYLRELHARGMTFSKIADAINEKFKTAYTRNAMIGRATRMALTGLSQPIDLPALPLQAEPPPSQTEPPPLQKVRERPYVSPWPKVPAFRPVKQAELRCVETRPRHLSLVDLERGDCRYPYGGEAEGDAITFCGRPRRRGSSYCTPHFHLSRGTGTPAERTACIVLLNWCKQQQKPDPRRDETAAAPSSHAFAR